ncbi:MAG: F0F1 ATP synthase subunit delta [Gammaproteobacteria bacterium]|nr:F0F1 ATP synthase subunit delta [Gammaproteobacteria bacterium]
MADHSTTARPYAKAIFELAQSSGQLGEWSSALQTLATIAQDERMRRFVADPGSTPEQVADLVLEVAGPQLDEHGRNFVRLLAENQRIPALTDIAALYEVLKTAAEGAVEVQVTSVEELSDAHRERLGESLRRKLGREVRMSFDIDKSLLGGALIKAGDMVIDGTVRGRLQKLTVALAD